MYEKTKRYNIRTKQWDLYVDGILIGHAHTPIDAIAELNSYVYHGILSGTLPPPANQPQA